jgi:hypothetical protein
MLLLILVECRCWFWERPSRSRIEVGRIVKCPTPSRTIGSTQSAASLLSFSHRVSHRLVASCLFPVDHSRYAKLNLAQTNRRQSGACRQIRSVGRWLLMSRSFARSKFEKVKVETPDSTRLLPAHFGFDPVELGLRGEVIQQPAAARNAPVASDCEHVF